MPLHPDDPPVRPPVNTEPVEPEPETNGDD